MCLLDHKSRTVSLKDLLIENFKLVIQLVPQLKIKFSARTCYIAYLQCHYILNCHGEWVCLLGRQNTTFPLVKNLFLPETSLCPFPVRQVVGIFVIFTEEVF